jgi:hypothetical protein
VLTTTGDPAEHGTQLPRFNRRRDRPAADGDAQLASGCTAADFTGFVPGRIALIQRGSCFFG